MANKTDQSMIDLKVVITDHGKTEKQNIMNRPRPRRNNPNRSEKGSSVVSIIEWICFSVVIIILFISFRKFSTITSTQRRVCDFFFSDLRQLKTFSSIYHLECSTDVCILLSFLYHPHRPSCDQ
jgi:hypothetical protein